MRLQTENHIHKQPEQLPVPRSYRYLFRAGIKPAARSAAAAVDRSATVPNLLTNLPDESVYLGTSHKACCSMVARMAFVA